MPVSYNTFERLKDRGIAAFKNGDYKAAKPQEVQAVNATIKMSRDKTYPMRGLAGGRQELAP